MLLGEIKIGLAEGLGLQTGIDIAFKGEQGLAGVVGGKASLSLIPIRRAICGADSLRAS